MRYTVKELIDSGMDYKIALSYGDMWRRFRVDTKIILLFADLIGDTTGTRRNVYVSLAPNKLGSSYVGTIRFKAGYMLNVYTKEYTKKQIIEQKLAKYITFKKEIDALIREDKGYIEF